MSDLHPPDRTDTTGTDLPCGRDALDVVDRARAGTSTEHERTCRWCQDAIAAADPAARGAGELATAEHAIPTPDTLLPTVMRTVWSELRGTTMIPLRLDTDGGSAFVAEHAAGAVVEDAVDAIADLQLHTCSVSLDTDATDDALGGADPGAPRVRVSVTAAAAYLSDVTALAAEVRALVGSTVAEQFGWTVDAIDIDIVDIYVPEGRQP